MYAFYPIHTANLNAIKAIGRSDLYLKLEIAKTIVGITILFLTMNYGPLFIAVGLVIETFIAQIINSFPNSRLLSYHYIQQLKDIFPALGLSIIMGAIVYSLSFFYISSSIILLMLQIFAGVLVYWGGSVLFNIESYRYVKNMILKKHK